MTEPRAPLSDDTLRAMLEYGEAFGEHWQGYYSSDDFMASISELLASRARIMELEEKVEELLDQDDEPDKYEQELKEFNSKTRGIINHFKKKYSPNSEEAKMERLSDEELKQLSLGAISRLTMATLLPEVAKELLSAREKLRVAEDKLSLIDKHECGCGCSFHLGEIAKEALRVIRGEKK